jgi:diguanylate cyclase
MYKILIIEDEPQIRENIETILSLEGFATITAEDGYQGLQMAEQHQPDIIICDVMMPNLDGYGLLRVLRQHPPTSDIPFIFLTAKAEYPNIRQGMGLGADDYLTKPFDVNELLQVVSTQLEKRQKIIQRYKAQIQEMEAQIHYLARHDSTTDLSNQLFLEEYFDKIRLQADEQGEILPILLINIDILYRNKLFLQANVRQLLLKAVAERLNQLNSQDKLIEFIAYFKTDQLALLLKPVQISDTVAEIAEQILASLSQPLNFNNQEVFLKPKVSIACYPEDATELKTLLHYAEVTLEHYKQQNTVSFNFYNHIIHNFFVKRSLLEKEFLKGIENQEFQIYYQPQINVETGKIICVEALIRWVHPVLGVISPGEFIPIAEESGLIIPLGEWILKTACLEIKQIQAEGFSNLNLAVNISVSQFRQENFVSRINDIINQNSWQPALLKLELTENVFIEDITLVKNRLDELKKHGIQISIDDFGTGYSSFKYIQEFSCDQLKVDQYFIRNIESLESKQSIVKSIIQLAQGLNINIIAEGVETENELNWLKQNSCTVIQGYFFSRPLALEDLKKFLLAYQEK